jgi:multidrug efflux system membrane fusion protein
MSETQDTQAAQGPRHRRTKWILAAVAAVLIILVLVHLFAGKPPAHGAAPQVVKVAHAARGDMPEMLSELGTVTPDATVTVLPQLSGYLTEVGYKEGQDVKKGQFLAQIDPRQYEIDLQQAQAALLKDQASLDQARSDLARYHEPSSSSISFIAISSRPWQAASDCA